MGLSPEERRKIYEEEKARIEAREHIEREKKNASTETSTGLMPNIASFLCYLGGWISGIILFVLEQKNARVRFHAAQSIVTFGALTVIGSVLGLVPFAGHTFSTITGILAFILWIVLMVKAYNGEMYRLVWAADIADRMVGSMPPAPEAKAAPPVVEAIVTPAPPSGPEPAAPHIAAPAPAVNLDKEIGRKIEDYFTKKRGGRITASAFAIAFSIVALIVFHFFRSFIAFYTSHTSGDVVTWTRAPFFTSEINLWLPVLTTALIVTIIGHCILIVFDKYILRELMLMVIDAFSLASVITLLVVFPFNFYVISSHLVAEGVEVGVVVTLICVSIGIGIGILVRGIKLLVNLLRGKTSYESGA
jgi:uncharacterized membrane protein